MCARAWMCGGAVRIVTCSHVAVRDAQQAVSITDHDDYRHIVELMFTQQSPRNDDDQDDHGHVFTDDLRRLVYHQAGVAETMSSHESESLMVRRNYLRQQHAEIQCHPFSWYLSNVAMSDVVRPSTDAEHFGKLRSASSGLCLGADSERSVEMVTCRDYVYERQLLVEMTVRGALVRDGSCLEPIDTTVSFTPCEKDSPRQHWWLVDGRLTPVTAPRKCLTDTLEHADRTHHLAMLEDCAGADGKSPTTSQQWTFINF